MIRQSQAITLLMCALLGTGCMGDAALGPDASSLDQARLTVLVSPSQATVFAASSGNTVRLTIEAYDDGATLFPGSYPVVYSSSAPRIASVNGDGIVTGIAPGIAWITATVTIGGATRAATVVVTVAEPPFGRISGVYDLVGEVTSFDPAWGVDLTGYPVTAVLEFWGFDASRTAEGVVGTFMGGPYEPWSGSITHFSLVGPSGLFGLRLGNSFGVTVMSLGEPDESGVAPVMEGSFGWGGHIGGTFVATRRPY